MFKNRLDKFIKININFCFFFYRYANYEKMCQISNIEFPCQPSLHTLFFSLRITSTKLASLALTQ